MRRCPCRGSGHTKLTHRTGAGLEGIMEVIWVAEEMGAGGADAHASLAVDAMEAAPAGGGG